jgi:hypothetical protein
MLELETPRPLHPQDEVSMKSAEFLEAVLDRMRKARGGDLPQIIFAGEY